MGNSSTNSTNKKSMKKRQQEYLKILKKCAGLVSHACEKYGIDRQTHYNWLKGSEWFADEVKAIQEGMVDFAESKLYENIKKGDNTSILFYLKCKAKKRGYVEKQEIEHSGNVGFDISKLQKYLKE